MTELEVSRGVIHKKGRSRKKKLYQQISEQMEFYFSDANLHKDRFLKQQVTQSADGSVDLEMFLRFNKIRALTMDLEVILKALKTSKLLEVNRDSKTVRRLTAFSEPTDADDRTVYVECLPAGSNIDWIKKNFESCGKVLYVSLPKFKSTGDIKGFAFVEFDTIESAKRACEMMNNPPASASDKVGIFPRASKQEKHLEKQVQSQEGRKRRASVSLGDGAKRVKLERRRTMSEGKDEEVMINEKDGLQNKLKNKNKRRRTSDEDKDATLPKMALLESKGVEDLGNDENKNKSEDLSKSKSNHEKKIHIVLTTDDKDEPRGDQKVKIEESHDEKHDGGSKKKIKSKKDGDEFLEMSEKNKFENLSVEAAGIDKEMDVKIGEEEEVSKKRKHKKSKTKEKVKSKDIPELRVLSKSEWLQLRKEYLNLQKENMKRLKERLRELNPKVASTSDNNKEAKNDTSDDKLKFIPGVIIKVQTTEPVTRKILKEKITSLGNIAYIDLKEGDTVAHVRCADCQTAVAMTQADLTGCSFELISGDDEQQYWNKILADREKKLGSKSQHKHRGRDKILQRADKCLEKLNKRKHIVFDQ